MRKNDMKAVSIMMLAICWPVGIIVLWCNRKTSLFTKVIITGALIVFLAIAFTDWNGMDLYSKVTRLLTAIR